MPDYRRNRVSGGAFFFTVNLLDRRSNLLVKHIDALRAVVRWVRAGAPFHIDAWVVLPDHMHCLWTPVRAGSSQGQALAARRRRLSRRLARTPTLPSPAGGGGEGGGQIVAPLQNRDPR